MKLLAMIIAIIAICFAVGEVINVLSDTSRVVSIEQKAINGDVPNATNEMEQFTVDKTTEAANDMVSGVIVGVIIAILTPIFSLIVAIIKMF